MIKGTIPFRRAFQQPLTSSASAATVTLSFTMTLVAAIRHWPANLPLAVGTAITVELCKVALACAGISDLRAARTYSARAGALIYLILSITFATGSVAASMMCMSQAEGTEHADILHASRAYSSAVDRLSSLDAQLAAMQSAANKDIEGGFRMRGLATIDRIAALDIERQAAEQQVIGWEQHPTPSTDTVLSIALNLFGINASPNTADFVVEMIMGAAIEIAGYLFLWRSVGTNLTSSPQAVGQQPLPPPPPQKRGPRTLRIVEQASAPPNSRVSQPQQSVPPTYSRRLRFDCGARLERRLEALQGRRCFGACRDLLHRIGNHCLRVLGTDGTIDAAMIRRDLRGGRDWRTIEGYLKMLVGVGALTFDGSIYTVVHFLEANPTSHRRAERLADLRHKARKRQSKHRNASQSLHAEPWQEVDLTASRASRHTHKPQTTAHASVFKAAYAATHKPTNATKSQSCNSVGLSRERKSDHRSRYGSVAETSDVSDSDHAARMERLASRGVTAEEANEAADTFENSLRDMGDAGVPQPSKSCIAVRIPDAPFVNEGDVVAACRLVGLPEFGPRNQELFRQLASDSVTQAELAYAAWCTKHRQKDGGIKQSVVGFMLAVIRRQRTAQSDSHATAAA